MGLEIPGWMMYWASMALAFALALGWDCDYLL
jgi:hypothetical protein